MHGLDVLKNKLVKYEDIFDKGSSVIEIGSSRDNGSTFHLATLSQKYKMNFYTIDPDKDSHQNALDVFKRVEYENLYAILDKGERYLKNFAPEKIVLAYLDGFDIVTKHPHKQSTIDAYFRQGIDLLKDGNKISAGVHFEATKYIVKNAAPKCIICFDDTWYEKNEWMGKGATAIPYLITKNFKLITPRAKMWYQSRKYNHGVALIR